MTIDLSPEDLAALIDALSSAELVLQDAANELDSQINTPILFALEHGEGVKRIRALADERKALRQRLKGLIA